ncbi:class I SAM-dependent methyltransferase [Turneriella parva]|uniref:Methyltransferase type 11 n=1 Tax=Turneriella parva (strain ATCC BAA-1111 / DSM 21527 / NCTC 11395 / H) TaxID=869212 RepID=I4B9Q5_TURPD|nr:class I SAM-dependent methyltransferase [Turneriella parva]AFM14012.1 Methyltransferase type 11 [Turneriella parva DSM 21527]
MQTDYFNLLAKFNHAYLHPGGLAATETLLSWVNWQASPKILEVACGVGRTSLMAAKRGAAAVIGIDESAGMIASAKENLKRQNIQNVNFTVLQAEANAQPDKDYDVVICEGATAFFSNRKKGISEIKRVLKPGGIFLTTEFYYKERPPEALIQKMSDLMGKKFEPYSLDDWLALYGETGFTIGEIISTPRNKPWSRFFREWRENMHFFLFSKWHPDRPKLNEYFSAFRENAKYLAACSYKLIRS